MYSATRYMGIDYEIATSEYSPPTGIGLNTGRVMDMMRSMKGWWRAELSRKIASVMPKGEEGGRGSITCWRREEV